MSLRQRSDVFSVLQVFDRKFLMAVCRCSSMIGFAYLFWLTLSAGVMIPLCILLNAATTPNSSLRIITKVQSFSHNTRPQTIKIQR